MDFIEVNKYIDELRLSGHTWEQVSDILNAKYGKTRNKDTWRKPYEAWKATVNDILNDTDNEMFEREIERIARAKTRLDINRKVLNAQKNIIDDEVRKESKYALFNEEVQTTLLATSPKVKAVKLDKGNDYNYVFVNSDSHYNGSQDLDFEFSEKFEIIKREQEKHGFKNIIFVELGDTIEGATLRPSQLMAIKIGMVKQATIMASYYIHFLNRLTEELKLSIDFNIVESSNHTELRQFGASRSELPLEDFMIVIAEQIKLGVMNNKKIQFTSGARILREINGVHYLFEHGHNVKNIDTHIRDTESYTNKTIYFGYIGHFHRPDQKHMVLIPELGFDKIMTVVGHSNTSDDDYADRLQLSSAPSIHFAIDSALEGKIEGKDIVLKQSMKKKLVK